MDSLIHNDGMKVILLQDVKRVGQRGSVVEVADGYAQNVLIPKKMALPATGAHLKRVEKEQAGKEEKRVLGAALAERALKEIDGKTVTLKARANESGGLFEAIREKQIIEAIEHEFGIHLPESAVVLPEPIKKIGNHAVQITEKEKRATLSVAVISL